MNTNSDLSAFPSCDPPYAAGLTKRELFAAMAMQGLAHNQETLLANNDLINRFGTIGIDKLQANKAVRLADALLAELDKPNPPTKD